MFFCCFLLAILLLKLKALRFDSVYFQVGDGTTSVVLLTAEFLKHAKPFIEDGVHQRVIIRAFKKAAAMVNGIFFEIGVN